MQSIMKCKQQVYLDKSASLLIFNLIGVSAFWMDATNFDVIIKISSQN
jgi:hypothetical protein